MGASPSIVLDGGGVPPAPAAGRCVSLSLSSPRSSFNPLSLLVSGLRRRRRRRTRSRRGSGEGEWEGDSNKSWLLAGAWGEGERPYSSVHSSFRLSFGSEEEAERRGGGNVSGGGGGPTIVLLVNLDCGGEADGEGDRSESTLRRRFLSLERSIASLVPGLRRFRYADIRAATKDFCKGRELGMSPLSRVYRGRIGVRKRAVAIKRVEGSAREGTKAFCRELMIASFLQHPNVVPLIGFCIDSAGLFLVYKYVSDGNLGRHLHHHDMRVLPWKVRHNVALGVARAIRYLHHGTDKCVIHRDIKTSNILLSSRKTPKLCDFGLAMWVNGPSLPFLCKAVKGTFGYLAPEYFQHGKLSDKTDVYSFGVVLLELITGRKVIDRSRPQGEENLVLWAKPRLLQGSEAMGKLVDPRLKLGSFPENEMNQMIRAAAACINSEESERPHMDHLIRMLKGEEDYPDDWSSLLAGDSCLAGYGYQHLESHQRKDMGSHLALAMLGVSDAEEYESHCR